MRHYQKQIQGDRMKNVYAFVVSIVLGLTLLSSCAKYDYHSRVEITNEDQMDMPDQAI